MKKAEGAFLTISELAGQLGLPQHILRYWETRFPQLRPLQRSGNRRYYRPGDVALAQRIHHLLHVEGFTVKGAQKALTEGDGVAVTVPAAADPPADDLVVRLEGIRAALAAALKN
ncbi:MerR family transcriptional regulator [Sphingobium sp. BYY-5]|uniref:MerR family transcriptional regulator n=1 Tax=Sphingobium sp. BYY-5 TaxID=2926400 RepID=UPI001FA6C827|nr:MerR family transcriptional regulator [Sphingobium sp. BYY-5]MCI4591382.1 MerR family transcriptional regulator [Sphingobium sp. BYY-5]